MTYLYIGVITQLLSNMDIQVVKVDGATPKTWRFVRGHDNPRLMGVASHLLSRWYTHFGGSHNANQIYGSCFGF